MTIFRFLIVECIVKLCLKFVLIHYKNAIKKISQIKLIVLILWRKTLKKLKKSTKML